MLKNSTSVRSQARAVAARPADADRSRLATVLAVLGLTLLAAGVTRSALAEGVWTTDYEAAVAQATAEGKPLLLEFTGSDWCPPCKALDANVFSTEKFKTEAPKSYVLVKLDFPNSKPQSDELKQQNRELAEKYDISGYPTVMLTTVDGRPYYSQSGYGGQDADAFLAGLAKADASRLSLEAGLKEAAGLEGVAKAEALDRALSNVSQETALAYFREDIDQLIAAAEEGQSPLAEKWKKVVNSEKMEKALQDRLGGASSPEEALEKLEEVMEEYEPEGESLQRMLMIKSNIVFSMGDKPGAKAMLMEARIAAPDSELASQIDSILEQYFADVDDAEDTAEEATEEAVESVEDAAE